MDDNPQLRALERRAYRATVDDGLLDILLGGFLLVFGLSTDVDVDFLPALFFVVAVNLWPRLRAWLVEPRIGHVRLHARRQSKIRRGKRVVVVLLFLFVLALGTLVALEGSLREQMPEWRPMITALMLGVPIAVAGIVFEMRRLVVYAAILLLAAEVERAFGLAAGAGLNLAGGLVTVAGIVIFAVFIHRNPAMPSGAGSDA